MTNETIYAVLKTDRYSTKVISLYHRFEDAYQSAVRLFLENVETSTANKKDIYQNIQPYLTLNKKDLNRPVIRLSLDTFNDSDIEIDYLLNTARLYSNWNDHLISISVQELPKTVNG